MDNLELFIKFLIALIIIVVFAQLFGRAIKLIGQPSVVGEMVAGVVLGPSLFGYFFPDLSLVLFPKKIMPVLFSISNLGLTIYMFLVGAELNSNLFNRKTIRDSAVLSIVAIVVPFLLGGLTAHYFNHEINKMRIDNFSLMIFLGTSLAITAFPMLARILQEKNIVNTRIGALSLISASIQDVVSWIALGFVTAMCTTREYSGIGYMIIGVAILVVVLFYIVQPFLVRMAEKVKKFEDLSTANFAIVILLLLASALTTDKLGLYSVFGGFILGLAMPRNGFFIQAISMRLKDITVIALLPVFFTFSGLNTNILILGQIDMFIPTIAILFVAFVSKYVGCLLAMRFSGGFSWRESSAVGALMNSRGLMELIIANIGLSYGLIDTGLYSILVLVAVFSTLAAVPLYNLSMGKNSPG